MASGDVGDELRQRLERRIGVVVRSRRGGDREKLELEGSLTATGWRRWLEEAGVRGVSGGAEMGQRREGGLTTAWGRWVGGEGWLGGGLTGLRNERERGVCCYGDGRLRALGGAVGAEGGSASGEGAALVRGGGWGFGVEGLRAVMLGGGLVRVEEGGGGGRGLEGGEGWAEREGRRRKTRWSRVGVRV